MKAGPGELKVRNLGLHPACPGCNREADVAKGYPFRPDWFIHPSEHVKECLEHFKITTDELIAKMGITRTNGDLNHAQLFMEGDRPMTADLAWRLYKTLGPSPEYWMNLQRGHDLVKYKPKGLSKLKKLKDPKEGECGCS